MGIFRDTANQEIDIVKEMAESLGSTGLKLDDILERAREARHKAELLIDQFKHGDARTDVPSLTLVNASIMEYNAWVDKAEDALRWLLIQREACGFRTHRNVDIHYPIPSKIRLLSS